MMVNSPDPIRTGGYSGRLSPGQLKRISVSKLTGALRA